MPIEDSGVRFVAEDFEDFVNKLGMASDALSEFGDSTEVPAAGLEATAEAADVSAASLGDFGQATADTTGAVDASAMSLEEMGQYLEQAAAEAAALAEAEVALNSQTEQTSSGFGDMAQAMQSGLGLLSGNVNMIGQMVSVLTGITGAGALMQVGEQAFNMAKGFAEAGAESIRAMSSFGVFAGGIDLATSSMERLTTATGGEVAQSDLARLATQTLTMGIVGTTAEVERMFKAAEGLADVTGKSATQGIESMTYALMTGAPRALRRLGIDADEVTTRIKELTAANTGLSDEQIRFQAVMESTEKLLNRVGDSIPTDVDALDRFSTSMKNFKAIVGEGVLPALASLLDTVGPIIRDIGKFETGMRGLRGEMSGFEKYVVSAFPPLYILDEIIRALVKDTSNEADAVRDATAASYEKGAADDVAVIVAQRYAEATDNSTDATERYRSATEAMTLANVPLALSAGEVEVAMRNERLAADATAQIMTPLMLATAAAESSQRRLQFALSDLATEMRGELTIENDAYRGKMSELGGAAMTLGSQIDVLASKHPTSPEQLAELAAMRGELFTTQLTIQQTAAEHQKAVNQIVLSMIEARLATDGWTQAEVDLYIATAEKMGLVDSTTRAAVDAVNQALGSLDTSNVDAAAQSLVNLATSAGTIMMPAVQDAVGQFGSLALTTGLSISAVEDTSTTAFLTMRQSAISEAQAAQVGVDTAYSEMNTFVAGIGGQMVASIGQDFGTIHRTAVAETTAMQSEVNTQLHLVTDPRRNVNVTSTGLAGAGGLIETAGNAASAVNSIPTSRTITITTVYVTVGTPLPGMGLQYGGIVTEPETVVGETGPEVARFPVGTHVYPNYSSEYREAATHTGMAAAPRGDTYVDITIPVSKVSDFMDQAVFEARVVQVVTDAVRAA